MFRHNLKLMIVLGLFVGSAFDVQAGRKSGDASHTTQKRKSAKTSDKSSGRSQTGRKKQAQVRETRRNGVFVTQLEQDASPNARNPRTEELRAVRQVVKASRSRASTARSRSVKAVSYTLGRLSAAHKGQLTKAGITNEDLQNLAFLVDLANSASLSEFLTSGVPSVEVLNAKIVQIDELLVLAEKVLAKRDWKFIAPIVAGVEAVKPQLEAMKINLVPQLAALKRQLDGAIAQGQITGDAPIRAVVMDHTGTVLGDSDDDSTQTQPHGTEENLEEDDAVLPTEPVKHNLTPEQVSYVQQALNICAQEKGMVISAGTIGLCYIIAGVCCPVIIPAMATGTVIGAGVGGVMSVVCGCDGKTTAKNTLRGALGGTVAPLAVELVTPAMVGGSLFAEGVVEAAVTGFITGSVSGADDKKILVRAFQGAACGAAFGAVLYGAQSLYTEFMSLRETQQQLLAENARLQEMIQSGNFNPQQIETLTHQVNQLQDANKNIMRGMAEQSSQTDSLRGQLNTIVAENANQQAAINTLGNELAGARDQINQLGMQNQQCIAELQQLKNQASMVPTMAVKPWIERVYDKTGLTWLFGARNSA